MPVKGFEMGLFEDRVRAKLADDAEFAEGFLAAGRELVSHRNPWADLHPVIGDVGTVVFHFDNRSLSEGQFDYTPTPITIKNLTPV